MNHWTRFLVFTAYLVKFQEIFMDFISYRILHLSCQWIGESFEHWAICTISASRENSRSLCSQVFVYFQGFNCMQSSCMSVNFSIFLAYFTKKRKQNFRMARKQSLLMWSKFISCSRRISASALNAVNFWSILKIE